MSGGGISRVVKADETETAADGTAETEEPGATEEPEATGKPAETEAQTISLKISKKTYTADQFRTGKKTFQIGASAKTALIKRWTPKGTYKISVTAKATEEYRDAQKTVTVTVKKAPVALMSKVKVNWDLKADKTIASDYIFQKKIKNSQSEKTFTKKGSVTVKNLKKVKVSNGKRYKVTCTVQYKYPTALTKAEVDGIIEYGTSWNFDWCMPSCWLELVDYQTGKSLAEEKYNDYGVKASFGKWKFSGKKYYGSNDNWLTGAVLGKIKISFTYPAEMKDICLVTATCPDTGTVNGEENAFEKGKISFNKFYIYAKWKKYKNSWHGLRLN